MKLSKDDLNFALVCAKSYYYDSLNSDYPNKNDQENWELFHNLEQAENSDTLEIEGYSRDKWTELDPNDWKTFPPMYESVLFLVYWKHFDPSMKIGFYDNDEFQDDRGHYIRAFSKILWRPLPNPPQEGNK